MGYFIINLLLVGTVNIWTAYGYSSHNQLAKTASANNSSALGIYDGSPTTIEKHPYIVAIWSEGSFVCAGSIVADTWVLLAADRVSDKEAKNLEVVAGSQDRVSGKKYAVVQIVLHPKFDYFDYDYALLQVDRTFEWSNKIKKISLASRAAAPGSRMVIAGWGDRKSDASLREGEMRVISLKKCKAMYSGFAITLTNRMVCVYSKGKTTLCDDDWSDPVTEGNKLHSFFIAIAHRGECSGDALPSVCASVYPAIPWIRSVINSTLRFQE